MDVSLILIIMQKEIRDARRNRWFLLYAAAFAILTLALAWFSLAGMGNYGLAGFGRTTASLVNLVLLIVPLMGLTLGAISLGSERESGTLLYLLAQPLDRGELLLGKFLGLVVALTAALVIGFGLTGLVIGASGGLTQLNAFLTLTGLTILLATVSLSIGLLISAAANRSATAVGIALFVWLILVFFGDLGLMGTAVVLKFKAQQLLWLSFINPLQLFKTAALLNLRQNLEMMGPAGIFAARTYGKMLTPLLIGLLMAWIVAPLLITWRLFSRRGAV